MTGHSSPEPDGPGDGAARTGLRALPAVIGRRASRLAAFAAVRRALRSDLAIPVIVLVVALLIAYREVVFAGRTVLPEAQAAGVMGLGAPYGWTGENTPNTYRLDPGASAWGMEPWTAAARDAWLDGDAPLWNASQGAGMPLAANMQSGVLDPLKLPLLGSRSPAAWDLFYLLRLFLGGLACLLLARRLKLSVPGGGVLALGFLLSGHFLIFNNNHWLDSYLALPVLFLGIETIVAGRRLLGTWLTAGGAWLAIVAGMPEVAVFVLAAAGFYAVWRCCAVALGAKSLRTGLGSLALAGGGVALGFALAAPLLLLFTEYQSLAFHLHASERALGLSHESAEDVVYWLAPYFSGTPLRYLRVPGAAVPILTYCGVAIFASALLSLAHRRLGRTVALGLAAFAAIMLAKTYGVPWINESGRLPVIELTLFAKWSAPVAGFAVALMAAIGVDAVGSGAIGRRAGWVLLGAATVLSALAVLANRDGFELLDTRATLTSAGVGLIVLVAVFVAWALRGRLGGAVVGWILLAVVAGELLFLAPEGIYAHRYDPMTPAAYVDFLEARSREGQPFRVFGLDGMLFPNVASAFDLQDARALDALYPERYINYVRRLVSAQVYDRFVGGPYASLEQLPNLRDNRYADLLGIRYVVTRGREENRREARLLIDDFLASPLSSGARRTRFTIDGVTTPVLVLGEGPATLEVAVPATAATLRFRVAIQPAAWGRAEPADFEVSVDDGSGPRVAFSRRLDPRNRRADRSWLEGELDLSAYLGRTVRITLAATPGEGARGWGDLRLTPLDVAPETLGPQYRLVYDGEARVYENTRALPRAFLVGEAVEALSPDEALELLATPGFEPSSRAIVEGLPAGSATTLREPTTKQVDITTYEDQRVEIEVTGDTTALLVLTDTFYPGWRATIDDAGTAIYATDYLFRGVVVPPGTHRVVFEYQPGRWRAGLVIAGLALLAATLATAAVLVRRRRARRVDTGE